MKNKFNNPELVIFTGPMFSSKTTALLMSVERAKRRGQIVLAFKPDLDGRYSDCNITSHMGWNLPATSISSGNELILKVKQAEKNNPDKCFFIVIDEAFMLDGIAMAILDVFKRGHTVYVASIQLSSNGDSFQEIQSILPYATRIEINSAVCAVCGDDAYYTYRIGDSQDVILIGGQDRYEPRCWSHFPQMRP